MNDKKVEQQGTADDSFIKESKNWDISVELLSLEVPDPSDEPTEVIDSSQIKWTQYVSNTPSETEQEKIEKNEATKEQVDAGILRVKNSNNKPLLKDGKLNPELTQYAQVNTINKRWEKRKNSKGQEVSGPPTRMTKSRQNKIGPNDPCPCGSGKKFKKCHGRGQGFIKIK